MRAIVLTAFSFFSSNMDVPAASSIIDRISCGRMLSTLVILPVPPRFRISTTRHNNNTGARGRTLHDEEVGVVDVELDALEQVLHCVLRRPVPAEEVLARPVQRDLRNAGAFSSPSFPHAPNAGRTCLVTDTSAMFSNPSGALLLSELSKTIVTDARTTPAWPRL